MGTFVFLFDYCFCFLSAVVHPPQTFKNVLQQRSNNLKAQKDHRDMFVGSQSSTLALAPPSAYKPLGEFVLTCLFAFFVLYAIR